MFSQSSPILRTAAASTLALAALAAPALPQEAPGQFDVDADAAEHALERALVQTGSVLLPSGTAEVVPYFKYMRSESEVAGMPVLVGGQLMGSTIATERDQFQTGVMLRAGLPWAGQVDLTIPYVFSSQDTQRRVMGIPVSQASSTDSGIGDIRLGYTHSLTGDDPSRPNLLGSIVWDTNTGNNNGAGGMGSGFNELELALATTLRQDPLVFAGRIGYQKAFENNGIRPGNQLSFAAGTFLAVNPETSLQFGFSLAYTNDMKVNGATIAGSDKLAASLDLGLATILGRNTLLDTTLSVGLTEDAPDFGLTLSMPLRFNF